MHCFCFIAFFLAVLQSVLAVPIIAPRADTTATKGQSDQKCWGLGYSCGMNNYGGYGGWGYGGLGYGGLGYGGLGYGGLGYGGLGYGGFGYGGLGYGYNSFYGYPYGGGLYMKDAPDAAKTPSTSA